MGEDASIDDELYQKIYDNMLERLKDKNDDIRGQAVTALQRLQVRTDVLMLFCLVNPDLLIEMFNVPGGHQEAKNTWSRPKKHLMLERSRI